MAAVSTARILLRFHLRAGARLALRALTPIVSGIAAAMILYGSPTAILAFIGSALSPARVSPLAGALCAALCLVLARWSAPRVTLGVAGWLRHLPASGIDHRRAVCAAVVVAQGPILLLVVASGSIFLADGPHQVLPRLLGMAPVAWAAALASLPMEHAATTRTLAFAGAVLAAAGGWWALVLGLLLVAGAEARYGTISALPQRPRSVRRWHHSRGSAAAQLRVFTLRALGWRWLGSSLGAAAVLGAGAVFVSNNQLSPWQLGCAARLVGGIAAVTLVAGLAEMMMRRRPPWAWARSLPLAAITRVRTDAAMLTVAALPAACASALLHSPAGLAVALILPFLALRAASAIRCDGASIGGFIAEASLVVISVSLLQWLSLLALAATPLAQAVARDQDRSQAMARWNELDHLAVGDPLSRSRS